MPVAITTLARLAFQTLQTRINELEKELGARLESLEGKTHEGTNFNAHRYELIDDDGVAFTKLFAPRGSVDSDPVIQAWLASHAGSRVVCSGKVFVLGSL